ncbi:MAG TPA: hypothetical protein VMF55_14605 [Solirubrobacterales bacterium]|nr:hypothetical protein [Solirubrobacterales bacterium]
MTIALWLLLAAPGASAAGSPLARRGPVVDLVQVPATTSVGELARAGFSPGLMSAGLGTVTPDQTYLDIGAGNRAFNSLYDRELPPLPPRRPRRCPAWFEEAVSRAESAPDEIEPGLLVAALREAGIGVAGGGPTACPLGITRLAEADVADAGQAERGVFTVLDASLAGAAELARPGGPRRLVIAIAAPTGSGDDPVPLGLAGPGFDGDLTSDTTRTNGYVTSTDIAPTILARFGLAVPTQMSGQPIRTEGSIDPAGIESRGARMAVVSHRRGPVIGFSLLAWVLAALLLAALSRGAFAPLAARLLGLAVVYLPLLLLAGPALEPTEYPEMLLLMIAAPALAALTLAVLHDYRALAVAAALTVGAYAIDAIAGSPLSALSLLGPNPGLGVRFYGIGNELEALLAVLIVGGTGAGLAGFAPRLSPPRCAAAFLAIGLVLAAIFASGEFGADVGAAIVFPSGAAAAAVAVARGRRRLLVLVVAIPLAVVGLLALADLLTGANSHFTRSVLDAGGLHSLGDVAQRRLELSAHSFTRPVLLAALPIVAALALLAWWRRDRLGAWVEDAPAMRAALIGAVVATVVGTLANDSGALLLEIGASYLLVLVGWAWAQGREAPSESRSGGREAAP